MKRIMVFSPHPDDDVIGCGGSLVKHIAAGSVAVVVYMTSGDNGSIVLAPEKLVRIREAEARSAAEYLGINTVHFFHNPDGYLSCTWENLVRITTLLREFQPEVLYIPHNHDRHRDHRITHDLVVEAASWAGSPRLQACHRPTWTIETILCYEVGTPLSEYNYIEDITAYIGHKRTALGFHESQLSNLDYTEAMCSLNRFRGITTGRGDYCECFRVVRAGRVF